MQLLWLDGTKVTDAGLAHLKGLAQMQLLSLDRTMVTDAGLVHLEGFSNLTWLDLSGTKVTDVGVKKLQQKLPRCKISRPLTGPGKRDDKKKR